MVVSYNYMGLFVNKKITGEKIIFKQLISLSTGTVIVLVGRMMIEDQPSWPQSF